MPKGTEPAQGDGQETGRPVADVAIRYTWQKGTWKRLFDEQVKLIREDIDRARAEDKVICYLSCPISLRGGGFHGTNVAIARFTERRLLMEWGDRLWVLNPAQYQMESKEGLGLIRRHAEKLNLDLDSLKTIPAPGGGDYMRMWTQVLCGDDDLPLPEGETGLNTGRRFDFFYFLGPTDIRWFFRGDGQRDLTSAIENYFARKEATDLDFRSNYALPDPVWRPDLAGGKLALQTPPSEEALGKWEMQRKEFFRFYAVRASVNYSLGSHDEWNILCLLNRRRKELTKKAGQPGGDAGIQIAGYFDGRQIDPAGMEGKASPGYGTLEDPKDEKTA